MRLLLQEIEWCQKGKEIHEDDEKENWSSNVRNGDCSAGCGNGQIDGEPGEYTLVVDSSNAGDQEQVNPVQTTLTLGTYDTSSGG